MHPMSLSEMSLLFESLSDDKIAALASGEEPLDVIDFRMRKMPKMASSRTRAYKKMQSRVASSKLWGVQEFSRAESEVFRNDQKVINKYEELRQKLELLAHLARSNSRQKKSSTESWSRTSITPEIILSVKGLADEDIDTLEQVAELLQEALHNN